MAFHLKVISPEASLFEGEVFSIKVPAAEGQLGILTGHAPLLAQLGSGVLSFRKQVGGAQQEMEIKKGGFLFFRDNKAIVLSE